MGDVTINPLVLIGVGSSVAFSGLFYHLYRDKKRELMKLKEIPVFSPDEQLVKILKQSAQKRLHYVAVEGVVQADGEPLASKYVPKCFGVIQTLAEEEHWKYWNSLTRTWSSRKTNKREANNSVPFSLVSPGAYMTDVKVKVNSPMEASGGFLERVHHKVRHTKGSLVNLMLQGLASEKPVSLEESEEMLRVGSTLTGFGEVVLEGETVMRLQAPLDGRMYVLVPSDYRSFMDRHESAASMWKMLTVASAATAATLLAGIFSNMFGSHDRRAR
ncbi:mitochondrial ubiquitin ligase activator of nfkb 1-A [Neosynchiropus ocellatus]